MTDAGSRAPAKKRSRVAGSKSCGAGAQRIERQRGPAGGGQAKGGSAGLGDAGERDLAVGVQRLGDAGDTGQDTGLGAVKEPAVQHRGAQARYRLVERGPGRFDRPLQAETIGPRPVPASDHRPARDHAPSGRRGDMVQLVHERIGAGARQPPQGRFQPEDAAERRPAPDRAIGVGAERKRHHAPGDSRRRAARGAARRACQIVRIGVSP